MGLGHRMARLMPLLLAAASAKELQGVKHVLAGSEYSGSAAAQRDERALVFGDDVPADKFRSCKKHGSDPRFQLCPSSECRFPCLPFYLKPEFSLFPPLTLSHDIFDIDPIFYFVCMVF